MAGYPLTETLIGWVTLGIWSFLVGFMVGRGRRPAPVEVAPPGFIAPAFDPGVYAVGEGAVTAADRIRAARVFTGPGGSIRLAFRTPKGDAAMTIELVD